MAVLQVSRQEIKYPISLLDFKRLERKLAACLPRDPYTGPAGITVYEVSILIRPMKTIVWRYFGADRNGIRFVCGSILPRTGRQSWK